MYRRRQINLEYYFGKLKSPGKLNPLLRLDVIINDKMKIKAIYDSGANVSILNQKISDIFKTSLFKNDNTIKTLGGFSFSTSRATVKLKIGEITDNLDVYVVSKKDFSYDLLLGLDAIKKFRLIQDENLNISQNIENIQKPVLSDSIDLKEKNIEINFNENVALMKVIQEKVTHIEDRYKKEEVLNLLMRFKNKFAHDKFDIEMVKSKEAEIRMIRDEYVNSRPYKCSLLDEEEIKSQIKKLLAADLIQESESPFAAPVTLAFKKEDGKRTRLCIDFRKLNKLLIPDCQPFPTIQDIIDQVVNCKYFTTLDINSAFWCVRLKKEDQEKTAFVTKSGKFEFKVLPFGLKNSPAIFQRILSNIIRRNDLDDFCVNYVDDILIFSKSWEEHVRHIEKFFHAISEEGFKLKLSKCMFGVRSVRYLGHVISENKVSPAHENLIAIKKLKRPTDKSGVRSILGSINFYSKYIQNSAIKFEPLHNLLRKDVKFIWTEDCESCFKSIKDYLCSSPILAIYDPEKPVIIETDASYYGIGASLKQPQADGFLHPVAYFSRKLSATEKKMEVIHLECKAIKDAIKYWQFYLIGREFTVYSDHKPLENLRTKARTDETLGDLIHYLSQFYFKIVYKPGKDNLLADLLSRNPVLEYFEDSDAIRTVNMVEISEILDDQRRHIDELRSNQELKTRHGLYYRKWRNKPRLCVSQELGSRIIDKVHIDYGHIGPQKMAETIRPHFYFRNLDKMVQEYYRHCKVCLENKVRRGRAIGLLSRLGPASRPFEVMSLDTVGGFNGNRSTKRYLHILVDHFTRYVWISTSKGQSARDFIKLVDSLAQKEKIMILLADQYTGIDSEEFKTYLETKGIQIVFTSTDCASSNGLNERVNQTLVNRIRCQMNVGTKRAWSTVADECVAQYNKTIHSSTRFSPEYLLTGKKPLISPIQDDSNTWEEDRRQAFLNSTRSYEANKARIDKTRKEHIFHPGDMVYVENGSRLNRGKLDQVRIGPFKIVRQISSTFYEVSTNRRRKISNYFHSSKLTPFAEQRSSGGEV